MIFGISNKKGNKSIYTETPKTLFVYEERLKQIYKDGINVLIPNCMDGYSVLPLLRRHHSVDGYETNNILINGGEIDNFHTRGLINKINDENLNEKFNLYNKNFYETKIEKQYDFVYSYRSLHLKENQEIDMARKIRKLQSSVKPDGYIYIFYYLADDENDFIKYPKNSYFRLYEMKSYFNNANWEIIYYIENHIRQHGPHIYNKKVHFHKTGIIFAKKRNTRKKIVYKYTYNIF